MKSARSWSVAVSAILIGFVGLARAATAQEGAAPGVELRVGTGVEDREPLGTDSQVFPEDLGQLIAWTRVTGAASTTIEHVWRYQGDEAAVIPLEIGGSPWRTWSQKTIPAGWVGEWTIDVRDASGAVLASATVTVGNAP